MSWLLSFTSALMLWQMGNKNIYGPAIGLVNQVLWAIYAVDLKEWGLLPGIALFTLVHIRNLRRWKTETK